MGDFDGEVTLKLRTRMRAVDTEIGGKKAIDLQSCESVEVWRPKKRKPSAILINDSRPAVLRDLADWIEQKGDRELHKLEREMG
jgi:hypothetical protein